ncbi:MAG: 7-cyano-7-deazaguanine synthase QueC [Deltaproteobacteria bacterium]|nr:7-cyano-7-deazaguanine synthase QueC [Deltaproteobacteria bacterium]
MTEKAIALLSGGLDSYVSTALARQNLKVSHALTFDYGQRAVAQEIKAASRQAKFWRIKHSVIELPWLKNLGDSALTNPRTLLPRFRDLEKLKKKSETEKSAEAVWIPNRNGVFINIAAAFAEVQGATFIITGFNREEAATFPDNGSDYVHRINRALELSTLIYPPKVKSFVQEMNKKEMVKKFFELDLSIDFFWSCYEGGNKMCGSCESCARTKAAFQSEEMGEKIEFRFS